MVALTSELNDNKALDEYVKSLPSEYDTVMDWEKEEVEELKGTDIYSAIDNDRKTDAFRNGFDNNVKPLLSKLSLPPSHFSLLTFKVFTVASKAVVTRGFNHGSNSSGPYMIPVVDMLNHDHSPSRTCTTLKRDDDGDFYMDAERDIASGEEILHAYNASSSNSELLRTYGFVHPAPSLCTPKIISKIDIVGACRKAAGEIPKFNKTKGEEDDETWNPEDVWNAKESFLLSTPIIPPSIQVRLESPLSDQLVTACAIMMLNEEGFVDLFLDDDSPALLDMKVVMEEDYLGTLVAASLLSICEKAMEEYRTTLKEDEEMLKKGDAGHRMRCAITVRMEEKRAVVKLKKEALKALSREEGGGEGNREGEDNTEDAAPSTKRIKLF